MFRLFSGTREALRPPAPVVVPPPRSTRLTNPERYLPDAGLTDAVNVALLLGQPLLLTGEPGTGKTQLAYRLAWELGYDEPLKFETKSTSRAQDLFYQYDSLARFRDAQIGEGGRDARKYLSYNALGLAIVLTRKRETLDAYLPPHFEHPGLRRSVVLIDEVDKAPRDFPNDLLNELGENVYFRIPELGGAAISADPDLRPIIVITSNSEKDLPDAFLRRCVYYNITFPDAARLKSIIEHRLEGHSSGFLTEALDLFHELRAPSSALRKKPATAELLGWLVALRDGAGMDGSPLASRPELTLSTISNLVKTAEDQERAIEVVKAWLQKPR